MELFMISSDSRMSEVSSLSICRSYRSLYDHNAANTTNITTNAKNHHRILVMYPDRELNWGVLAADREREIAAALLVVLGFTFIVSITHVRLARPLSF